jgi:hypothetical protein
VGLALKCDETEASRSENTLQNVKNYKITRKCHKNISLHKQSLHTFRDSIKKKGKSRLWWVAKKKASRILLAFFVWVTIKER